VIYTAVVSNGGPDGATGVSLVVDLPSGIIPISVTPDGPCAFSADGTAVNCSLGALASGGSTTATIELHPVTVGMKTANAHATATEADPNPANNTHTASSTLTEAGISEVQVTLADGPDPLNVGVTYSSGSSDRGRCGRIGRLVTCRLGTLNPGTLSTATIKIVPNNPGFLHAAAGVAVGTADPSADNNSAAVRTWVNP